MNACQHWSFLVLKHVIHKVGHAINDKFYPSFPLSQTGTYLGLPPPKVRYTLKQQN